MIEFVEDINQNHQQEPTASSDNATIVAERSRTFGEQSQTVSDISATVAEPTNESPISSSFKRENYPLDLHQVLVQFQTAGINRTPRAIQRYCKQGKLDAYFHPTQRIYLVSTASVQKLIASIKEVDERHSNSLFRDQATHEPEQKATVADSAPNEREHSPKLSHEAPRTDATGDSRVRQLEAENQTLKIDKAVRDQIIVKLENQIRDDRDHFTEKLTRFARLAESFKTRLRLIGAPMQGRGVVDDISDVEGIEEGVMGHSDGFSQGLEVDGQKR